MRRGCSLLVFAVLLVGHIAITASMDAAGHQPGDKAGFTVPDGFRVEQAVKIPAGDAKFSLLNMCFDAKGRLLVSRENGPILLCTNPDKNGVLQTVTEYCTQVTNCQGMCCDGNTLYLVGKGPKGVGLYRCREKSSAGKIDEVNLLHAIKGEIGDHGPHAILHGPDGWLYLVLGNRAWADIGKDAAKNKVNPTKMAGNSPLRRWPSGGMSPEQGKAKSAEDVLLPRINDPRGNNATTLAPGGTIWRMDKDGKNMSLVAAGFRNQFDAAFAPNGELFTIDNAESSDEGLPWYRPARICHCPPGADFMWRAGSANTPDYYLDAFPPIAELAKGSPTGMEFYDHIAYPAQYRGALFYGDWTSGAIFATYLTRDGASFKAKVERFCSGLAMRVTDLAVGPEGALYFTTGGHGSEGGIFRIVYTDAANLPKGGWGQPQAAWSWSLSIVSPVQEDLWKRLLNAPNTSSLDRIRATMALQQRGNFPDSSHIALLLIDKDASLRAHAVWLLGLNKFDKAAAHLVDALADKDVFVRRRACEALIRAGHEPPIAKLWPLLGDKDRFVRDAARLVLERIDPKKWTDKCWKETNDAIAFHGIVALCRTNKATAYAEQIFDRLHGRRDPKAKNQEPTLEWLRTLELVMANTPRRPIWTHQIAKHCEMLFPHKDARFNRELATLLVAFQLERQLDKPVQDRLIKAMKESKNDRSQQIHYAFCMRLLRDGWTAESAKALNDWYEGTRDWKGGASYRPYLDAIFRECQKNFAKVIKAGSP